MSCPRKLTKLLRLWVTPNTRLHRRGSSVNFKGQDIFARKICMQKLTKCPNFTCFLTEKLSKYPHMIFARKINKIPEFYTIFWRKNAEILHNNCPKNIFRIFFFGGGGYVPPCPLVSYAYARVECNHSMLCQVASAPTTFCDSKGQGRQPGT